MSPVTSFTIFCLEQRVLQRQYVLGPKLQTVDTFATRGLQVWNAFTNSCVLFLATRKDYLIIVHASCRTISSALLRALGKSH